MSGFIEVVSDLIYRNLIAGNAYIVVLKGLWITILISSLGLLFGTILGGFLCWIRMSKIKLFKIITQIIIAVFRGSPVLLLLMILYYVVFANIRIEAIIIAVIAFAINSGAHIAEVMRSALEAVDKKQLEAARMLGFSKTKAFLVITLPQASKIAKPVYQNSIINLIQWTSVVGYVTITDLTRTVNNIGARTGEPFFALFFGLLIYLGISYSVYGIFSIGKRQGEVI
ncbi:ABC transporter permease subunit [Candidatus Contubernalis alkaliaceticus]|uniref:ABC transporter permease subunit n=1 Tax=Candidatus Contubernalis alkaliaceticus TaxID=338645 RepID=UPI001F4C46DF|nr:ABC transporter permease subunit [Candidatus Contubernalis alkalaceticus]UNC93493.1 ABC transporter permease subunit [Candidatus Contubernalis alkalaceticus]